MINPIETFPESFNTKIEGVNGTWYRRGSKMIVDTFQTIEMCKSFEISNIPEPMPAGFKGTELSKHITISTIGSLQTIRLTRVLEIEGWTSKVDHMGRLELEPVEVNETEELRQLVKEEVDKAMKSMLKPLIDKMEGR